MSFEYLGCKMADVIKATAPILIGHSTYAGTTAGKNCYFQSYTGEFVDMENVGITFWQKKI